jgi:hypothetical protein
MSISSRILLALAPRRTVRAAFTKHYESRGWGEPESVSGRGSTLRSTQAIRSALPALFAEFGVRSVIDAGCGDFNWFRTLGVDLERYLGIEVVDGLASLNQQLYGGDKRSFASLDILRDKLPAADLVLCRDCLVHLKNRQVVAALKNFRRSGSRYLLATSYPSSRLNQEVSLGGWRPLNLELPPFQLGSPLRMISEGPLIEKPDLPDKSLGLWAL